jgi:hypothetical protein
VEGVDGSLEKLTWQRIATGLFQPLGLKIVADPAGREWIYVCCRDQIARLHDLNGDGEIDFVECFNGDHQVTEHFHEFAMDLQTDREGNFYYAKSARHALDCVVPQHGTLMKVSADGAKSEIVCNGFRAANGVGIGPNGELAVSDQEGHWTPANRINLLKPGGFYGNLFSYHEGKRTAKDGYDPPVVWMPKDVDRSPAQQLWVEGDKWGLPAGNMISTSYGTGKIWLVMHENVNGVPQGAFVQVPGLQFPTGIMRGRFHPPSGQLYVCGLVGWSSNQAQPGGFYRVRYTGKVLNMPVSFQARKEGLAIAFSDPLKREPAEDVENYSVEQWNYRWTANYGSDEYSVTNPNKKGHDEVEVKKAELSADGKTVLLKIDEIKPVMQVKIRMKLTGADGQSLDRVIWGTINAVPK